MRQSEAAMRSGMLSVQPKILILGVFPRQASRCFFRPTFLPVTTIVNAPAAAACSAAPRISPIPQAPPTTNATKAACGIPSLVQAILLGGRLSKEGSTGIRTTQAFPPADSTSLADCSEVTRCISAYGDTHSACTP